MNGENGKTREVPPHEVYIDYSNKDDEELRRILEELLKEERKISYQRRVLHGKIDILRAELVRRKKSTIGARLSNTTEVMVIAVSISAMFWLRLWLEPKIRLKK